jgi:formylglycine-generating enzyme required for sulfatase activity
MPRPSARFWFVALVLVGVAALVAVFFAWKSGLFSNYPSSTGVPLETHGRDGHVTSLHGSVETFDLGGGVTLEMVYIEGGSFEMGSRGLWGIIGEKDRDKDEGPAHRVDLDGFWMGKFEATQEQYEAVMGTNPSLFKGAKNPVETVSWDDATEFCVKLSSKTGRTFRLPTEAEWEYACRAGSLSRFSFGDSDSDLGDYAWFSGNSGRTTHPVGQKEPSACGLYDMHGNVWEWCADWFGSYSSGVQKNPTGPSSGSDRVDRGGGWYSYPGDCRSAFRDDFSPGFTSDGLGFRVALSPVR